MSIYDLSSKPASIDADQNNVTAFQLSFNNAFNEQFNRDFVKQQQLLAQNPRFTRTRQSVEVERRNRIGQVQDMSPYPLYQEDELRSTTVRKQAMTGSVECNLLNQLFFSPENIEYLHQRLRYEVFRATNQQSIICKQDDDELVIIMRSIYFTYSKNQPTHIKEQIQELNDLVMQECVPRVLSEIQAHVRYLYDASTNPLPLSLPQNMSNKGMKILPSVTSIFNV
jgi:hypothetical protein